MLKKKLKNTSIAQKSKEIKNKFAGVKTPTRSARSPTPLFPSLLPKTTAKKSASKTSRSPKVKSSPIDYYNCLMNYARQGFYDTNEGQKLKIHSCCKKCKLSAPTLNNQRDKEVVKLITSYKQVGDSLAKLLQPIK